MNKRNITIKSRMQNYTAFFEDSLDFLEKLKQKNGIWIIDRVVFDFFKPNFKDIDKDSIIFFDANENNKNLNGVIGLYRELISKSIKKNRPLISVGGGITQDVTGFVASTLFRGIDWFYVPTTLLAQTDSCIGSKTSLNFDSHKNLIGTFYAPNEVYISTEFLKRLPSEELYSGFGEIVKLQLINTNKQKLPRIIEKLNKGLKKENLSNLIYDSLMIKKEYIEEDEFDSGKRNLLNYGHCFGHALESSSNFLISHGIAVVIGMLFANIIALKRGYIDSKLFNIVSKMILVPNIHQDVLDIKGDFFNSKLLFKNMKKDKKRSGSNLALVLPKKDLKLELVQDLSEAELSYGIKELKKYLKIRKNSDK